MSGRGETDGSNCVGVADSSNGFQNVMHFDPGNERGREGVVDRNDPKGKNTLGLDGRYQYRTVLAATGIVFA